ncbi:hypothetical protein P7F88_18125 [Vibrio hannami]|uniref:hypothetical protein n=1 Tax=Vibrio hannami TaxID=2717094 RepID=UPI00240F040A|nr:hypothetical protein [Vibrio hannami]MDG3087885.1 hypothetical protein [Vibrio hannami]
MKRNSKGYRLQLIKETVERQRRRQSEDPMTQHIDQLLTERPEIKNDLTSHHFSGHHFDQEIGGWVSDRWH